MIDQPEALLLADALLEHGLDASSTVRMDAAVELRRLHSQELALQQWLAKTEWVQQSAQPGELGLHRADAIKRRFDHLRDLLGKANAQSEHFEREWYLRGDENEALRADAERYRFVNDSEEDFAICYWDETMGNGGEWMCNGSKGNAIDLLDAAIAKAEGQS
jgi:hypothetical protein